MAKFSFAVVVRAIVAVRLADAGIPVHKVQVPIDSPVALVTDPSSEMVLAQVSEHAGRVLVMVRTSPAVPFQIWEEESPVDMAQFLAAGKRLAARFHLPTPVAYRV